MSDNPSTEDTKDEMIRSAETSDNRSRSTGLIDSVVKWLSGQPFNNVMLFAIFAAGCYGAYWVVTIAVPTHLKQIQDGYEEIQQSNQKQTEALERINERQYEVIRSLLSREHGVEIPPLNKRGSP